MITKRVVLMGVAAAFAGLVGTAWATGAVSTIVNPDGTINGCYRVNDEEGQKGQLRVVAGGEPCKKNELAIRWNQIGVKGDSGPQGLAGPAGPQGAKGDTGDTGPKGDAGAPGPVGANGAAGMQGPAGPKGDIGPTGSQGPAGSDGISGYEIVHVTVNIPAGSSGSATAQCPAGKKVLGGGTDGGGFTSFPIGDNRWFAGGSTGIFGGIGLDVFAICANVS